VGDVIEGGEWTSGQGERGLAGWEREGAEVALQVGVAGNGTGRAVGERVFLEVIP